MEGRRCALCFHTASARCGQKYMFRISIFLFVLLVPINVHACMIVPSFWSRLVFPAVWILVAFVLLFHIFGICLLRNSVWWKLSIPIGCLLVANPIYRLYISFNFTGAVNCGSPFAIAALQLLLVSFIFWIVVSVLHRFVVLER